MDFQNLSNSKRLKKEFELNLLIKNKGGYKLSYFNKGCENTNRSTGIHVRKRVNVFDRNNKTTFVEEDDLVGYKYLLESADKTITAKEYSPQKPKKLKTENCDKIAHFVHVTSLSASTLISPAALDDTITAASLLTDKTFEGEVEESNFLFNESDKSFDSIDEVQNNNYSNGFDFIIDEVLSETFRHTAIPFSSNQSSEKTFSFGMSCETAQLFPIVCPHVLVVYKTADKVVENIKLALRNLGINFKLLNTFTEIMLVAKDVDCVILDVREHTSRNYKVFCNQIKQSNRKISLVALIKKEDFENDKNIVPNFFQQGFSKCLVENKNYAACYNEMAMLYQSNLIKLTETKLQNSFFHSLLYHTKNIIFILNGSDYKIFYCNSCVEDYLQFNVNDILGKKIDEKIFYFPSTLKVMEVSLSQGMTWQGMVLLKKKNYETVSAFCTSSPLFYNNDKSLYVIVSLEMYDNYESFLRFNSPTFISSIMETIEVIKEAREKNRSNNEVQKLLLRSIDILKIELNNTTSVDRKKIFRNDIVDNFLEMGKSISLFTLGESKGLKRTVSKINTENDKLLLYWNFDIFLAEQTSANILVKIGMKLLLYYNVPYILNCNTNILKNWLIVMSGHYHKEISYHNATHAADVMQACAIFMSSNRLRPFLNSISEAACLLAAAAHDLDHQGKTTAFLCNFKHSLALLYNDQTVLENHHVSLMFQLTFSDDRINIFQNLTDEKYKNIRTTIIDLILSTDMTKHFDILTRFVNEFSEVPDSTGENLELLYSSEKTIYIQRMIIKCADVSNPTRIFRISFEWSKRITEEYCLQTDEEKSIGLPVAMPMFDRKTCSFPKAQIGFIEYIVNDLFESWHAFIGIPDMIKNLRKNYKIWKQLDQMGYASLESIAQIENVLPHMFSKENL